VVVPCARRSSRFDGRRPKLSPAAMIEQKVIVFSRPLADKRCLHCGDVRRNSWAAQLKQKLLRHRSCVPFFLPIRARTCPRGRPQFILDMLLCFGECRQRPWTPPRTAFSRQNSRWSLGLDAPPQLQQLADEVPSQVVVVPRSFLHTGTLLLPGERKRQKSGPDEFSKLAGEAPTFLARPKHCLRAGTAAFDRRPAGRTVDQV
jgi:hypothetical protein